jgi:hypothetical protein
VSSLSLSGGFPLFVLSVCRVFFRGWLRQPLEWRMSTRSVERHAAAEKSKILKWQATNEATTRRTLTHERTNAPLVVS